MARLTFPSDRENRFAADRSELALRVADLAPVDGHVEILPGVTVFRLSAPTDMHHGASQPSLCVIAQGSKEVFVGDRTYRYDPAHYLIASMELPSSSWVISATADEPYLSLKIELDTTTVSSVMIEAAQASPDTGEPISALDVSPLSDELIDACVRLLRAAANPADARFVAPMITREIIYRLLMGKQGARLRQIAALGGQSQRIAQGISQLKEHYDEPLRIPEIAQHVGMSVSGFHHHFKTVTGMSPLQFQKELRLREARRLMLGEDLDAASAGFRVGYDSASQFSREYKRLFGEPPMRDIARLRPAPVPATI